jgi:hypothetical protein
MILEGKVGRITSIDLLTIKEVQYQKNDHQLTKFKREFREKTYY